MYNNEGDALGWRIRPRWGRLPVTFVNTFPTQGDALGWRIRPRWGRLPVTFVNTFPTQGDAVRWCVRPVGVYEKQDTHLFGANWEE